MKARDRLLQANAAVGQPPLDLRELLDVLQLMRDGDFSVRLPGDWTGLGGKIADTFNEIIATNGRMAQELERVGEVLGKEGKTRQRVSLGRPIGAWGAMEASVNTLISDLLWPTTEQAGPSWPYPRAICSKPCVWTWTVGRSKGSFCARPPSSTR